MEIKTNAQPAHFAIYLANGLLYDRLHELAAEYSLSVEQLADLAVERLIRDVEFVRGLRCGSVSGP